MTADGVLINNVTFVNVEFTLNNTQSFSNCGRYVSGFNCAYSPITVSGDYAEISGCRFFGTKAVNGGAIFWVGSMGKINSCQFVNCFAKAIGGAIYMDGYHNSIKGSTFINCTTECTKDFVFLGSERKKVSLKDCLCEKSGRIFDSKSSDFDPEIFHYSHMTRVADKEIDLIPLLYSSIADGQIHYLDANTWFYSEYFNESADLVFTMFRNFTDNGILYSKGYHFSNVKDVVEVFPNVLKNNYSLEISLVKNMYVNDVNSYRSAIKTSVSCFDSLKKNYMESDGIYNVKSRALNIILKEGITIDCKDTINPASLDFDVVNVRGNGAIIKVSSSNRDENKWLNMDCWGMFSASNLTVSGFNCAVNNLRGNCIFKDMTFKDNCMSYIVDRDWGDAMLNLGAAMYYNCHFENNIAKNCGAIFNQGYLDLANCSFVNNKASGEGSDVCVGDNGMVILNGKNLTSSANHITFAKSMSVTATTVIEGLCIAGSFVVGFVAGVITANPVIGAIVGGVVGAVAGSICTAVVLNNHYDVNFNRLKHALILIGGSIAAGVIGGIVGGYLGAYARSAGSSEIAGQEVASEEGAGKELINNVDENIISEGATNTRADTQQAVNILDTSMERFEEIGPSNYYQNYDQELYNLADSFE